MIPRATPPPRATKRHAGAVRPAGPATLFMLVASLVLLCMAAPAAAAPAATWADAQASETRLLKEELAALTAALAQARNNTEAARKELRREIDELQVRAAQLDAKARTLETDLPERERVRAREQQAEALDALLRRLLTSVDTDEAAPREPSPELLPTIFRDRLERMRARDKIRTEPASFFDLDGTEREAPVLKIGRVAALAMDDASPQALLPSPQGWRLVVDVERPPVELGDATRVSAVVFDPDHPPKIEAYRAGRWTEPLDAGGPVMWVLLVLAGIALGLTLERTVHLVRAQRSWSRERARFERAIEAGRAVDLIDDASWISRPLAIAASVRCPSCATMRATDAEERATQALLVMRERLSRRLSLVGVAAAIAPLLGLLGTVTGMIHTFSVVTRSGASDPQALAAGISEALLTTQFGLVIAIPAFLAHALLTRGARRILSTAEQTVLLSIHPAHPDHAHHPDHEHVHERH